MYKLVTFSNHRIAQAFVDYMATQHVQIELRCIGEDFELWLCDESQRNLAEKELAMFAKNPMDPRYREASWQIGTTDSGIAYSYESILSTIVQKAGKLTLFMMGLCLLIFLIMQSSIGYQVMLDWLKFPADSDQNWQIWRFITPILLHFSISHILFNLVLWWYLGGRIERFLGTGKLLEITLLSAFVSNYAESFFYSNLFGGISGVVYALIGYCWLYGELRHDRNIYLDRSVMLMALCWIVLGYADIVHNIANTAHLSGFLVGLALAGWNTFTWSRNESR